MTQGTQYMKAIHSTCMQATHSAAESYSSRKGSGLSRKFLTHGLGAALLAAPLVGVAVAQGRTVELDRDGRTIVLEPYAPNILRVTMSTDKAAASGRSRVRVCGQAFSRGMDARARRGRRRRIPLGPNGCARVAREPSEGETPAADAARCVESSAARSLLRGRGRAWSAQ